MRSPSIISAPTPRIGRSGYWRLILERSLHAKFYSIDISARGDEQRFQIALAKRAVRCILAFEQRPLELAISRINGNSFRSHIKASIDIRADSTRNTFDVFDGVARIAGAPGAIQIERYHSMAIGIAYIKQLSIRRYGNSIGPCLPLRENVQLPFRSDVPDAIEVEIAPVVGAAESRVGEIDMPVFANRNIVRRVELFPCQASTSVSDLPSVSTRVTRRVSDSQMYKRPCKS